MKILISPLDWGLGHATRLIPIIKKLSDNGNDIIIAGNGKSFALIKKYFDNAQFIPFYSIHFKYSKNGLNIFNYFIIAFQIIWQTFYEHFKLKKIIKLYKIDIIISDNRYGLFNKNVKSYFITHQLNVILPKYLSFANPLINSYLRYYLKKYDQILIPDYQAYNESLAGKLSHPSNYNKLPITYIGPLSRFDKLYISKNEKQYDVVILISAPLSYCKLIVKKLIDFASLNTSVSFAIISPYLFRSNHTNLTIINSPDDIQWLSIVSNAKNIISTAGYSTIMDLFLINKNAILVPVKGQTEQEYLANYLNNKYGFKKADSFNNAIAQVLQYCIKQ